jgi:hypothetical protein
MKAAHLCETLDKILPEYMASHFNQSIIRTEEMGKVEASGSHETDTERNT